MTLRQCRERIVREHMESENRHDFDTTIDTFEHPRSSCTSPVATISLLEGDRLVCERVYFDSATILAQLTGDG